MLQNCLHSLSAMGPHGVLTLAGAMFLTGLAGGVTHCAGMCGPFVIAQTMQAGPRGGQHLVPYHLGRTTGYCLLGAVAGAAFGLASMSASRTLLALPLVLSAGVMLLQAFSGLRLVPNLQIHLPAPPIPIAVLLRIIPRGGHPHGRGFLLGLLLSALPCGLLYAALASAAASGSALAGAIAMLAFLSGTLPALIGVSWLGQFFGQHLGPHLRLLSGLALLMNAVVLVALALRLV